MITKSAYEYFSSITTEAACSNAEGKTRGCILAKGPILYRYYYPPILCVRFYVILWMFTINQFGR